MAQHMKSRGGGCNVNGTGYEVTKGRTLVGGTGYDISFLKGTPVGELTVGSSIFMQENNVRTEFIVVNQGIPQNSSLYDSSCNGTWVWRKDIWDDRMWNLYSTNNDYENSAANSTLNNTYLNLLNSDTQAYIKSVKIPYLKGTGIAGLVSSGADGLSTKIFLLSAYEVGVLPNRQYTTPADGVLLEYFYSDETNKRKKNYNGEGMNWWLRTAYPNDSDIYYIRVSGVIGFSDFTKYYGICPAMILSPTATVDENNDLII